MQIDQNFSSCKRDALIKKLTENKFDVLIHGQGMVAAGMALEATLRGLNVALISFNDFLTDNDCFALPYINGGGIPLNNTKHKHRVENSKWLKLLNQNITHGIMPTPILWPVFKGDKTKKWRRFLSLTIHDKRIRQKRRYRTRWVKKKELCERYPFLNEPEVIGAFLHYGFKVNHNRVAIETLKKAVELGAVALHDAEIEKTEKNSAGIPFNDNYLNKTFEVKASQVIQLKSKGGNEDVETYPFQIIFHKERFPVKEAFCLNFSQTLICHIVPQNNHVQVMVSGIKGVQDKKERVEQVVAALKKYFPGLNLTINDVLSCVENPVSKDLLNAQNPAVEGFNNRTTIVETEPTWGNLPIVATVLNTLYPKTKTRSALGKWVNTKLAGSEWEPSPGNREFRLLAEEKYDQVKETQAKYPLFATLFYRYGKNVELIMEQAYHLIKEYKNPEELWLAAEVWYSVNFESTANLVHFFIHRTQIALTEPQKVKQYAYFVADIMGQMLTWNQAEKERELLKLKNKIKEMQCD